MAKKDKKSKRVSTIPEGMRCFQKVGGGNHRFGSGSLNARIIKQNQKFWCYPEILPTSFKDVFKEVAPDSGAVVIQTEAPVIDGVEEAQVVPEKFEMVKAVDEDGELIKKGDSFLYNVIGEDEQPLNDKPLRKKKAEELLETLNS